VYVDFNNMVENRGRVWPRVDESWCWLSPGVTREASGRLRSDVMRNALSRAAASVRAGRSSPRLVIQWLSAGGRSDVMMPAAFLAAYGNCASLALAETPPTGGWVGVVCWARCPPPLCSCGAAGPRSFRSAMSGSTGTEPRAVPQWACSLVLPSPCLPSCSCTRRRWSAARWPAHR
jgi:hypothetical protein